MIGDDWKGVRFMGWESALLILNGDLLKGKDWRRFVNFERKEIDFLGMTQESDRWSSSEKLMVRVAWSMFNGGSSNLGDVMRYLDRDNLKLVIEAMNLHV